MFKFPHEYQLDTESPIYTTFPAHYNSAPIACRFSRPEDKGKVESAIKYVKNDFLKNFRGSDYDALVCELKVWNKEVCNKRVHGTTRKIPETVFNGIDKQALAALSLRRYQVMDLSTLKVSHMAQSVIVIITILSRKSLLYKSQVLQGEVKYECKLSYSNQY
ncbi:hypothetical protein AY601_2036 [Pedobacter cryoconitis]|uniref:Integrase catalytic domain-containing protein n=1 Tax=Pedobacter cryoconitis TaxID=188932 RepID=A0A127VCJ6_9SPHI|nr:transposase [Pedobacter cryoconitis]AMP98940.1 hypothetical protein AY601_2036 [Pedobacter cryoconitis]